MFLVMKYSIAVSTKGVNFTNILRAPFSYESLLSSFSVDKLRFDFFGKRILAQKLLVKRW